MAICSSIATVQVPLYLILPDLLHFVFFRFYLCYAIPSPCYFIKTQPVSLLVLLPATTLQQEPCLIYLHM
jgi:hypothetical protein